MVGPRLPKSTKPTPPGRRLEGGIAQKSRWAGRDPNAARDEAKRSTELEKARDTLGNLLEGFIKLLTNKTLSKNRSRRERDYQKELLARIPPAAAELDLRNVKEGSMSIFTTAMNSLLVLRDEINNLRFQNYFLNKKTDERFAEIEERLKIIEESLDLAPPKTEPKE
jgi:hypothetical protein